MQTVAYAAAVLLYGISAGLHWDHLRPTRDGWGRAAWALAALGAAFHLLGIIHAVVHDGVAGLTTFEALPSDGAFLCVAIVLARGARSQSRVSGAFLLPVAMVLLAAMTVKGAFLRGGVVEAGSAGARTAFTPIHVTASALGFLSFCASYALAALYVLKDARLRERRLSGGLVKLPPLQTLERWMYFVLVIGFVLFSVGAVLGAVWATGEGGGGFSPKYTLAALSWLSFALVLLLRVVTGWTGRRAAFLVAIGFTANLAVVMSYYARLV